MQGAFMKASPTKNTFGIKSDPIPANWSTFPTRLGILEGSRTFLQTERLDWYSKVSNERAQ